MAPSRVALKRVHPKGGIGGREGGGPRGRDVDILDMQVMALVAYCAILSNRIPKSSSGKMGREKKGPLRGGTSTSRKCEQRHWLLE
jgi:hypothetical protein